jgi:hypothetical protein
MAGTITITCPECEKPLKIPSDALGKKVRCKGCETIFPARAPTDKAGKPAKGGKPAEPDDDASPYTLREEYLGRRCPQCANAMEEEDRICLHCGYDTITREAPRIRKVRETTGGDVFLWLLPGILCTILVFTLIGFDVFYWVAISRETFGDVWYDFLGSLGMKVYTTVIILWIIYKAGKFAVIRLILNYTPPEIEEKLNINPR